MIVERIWTGNAYRNFNYLIACAETGEALAIDPLDHEKCLAKAKANGWRITQILNTHEHHDHTGGNAAVVAATGAKVIAHHRAAGRIDGVDRGVGAGDIIKVGKRVELECMDTPGHTMSHICVLAHGATRALFCGDTLFNAGAGNCHNGGHPNELYNTFATQLASLPEGTLIYSVHDYLANKTKVLDTLRTTNVLDDDTKAELEKAVDAFKMVFQTGDGQSLNSPGKETFEATAVEYVNERIAAAA